jgi:hypothetical protein
LYSPRILTTRATLSNAVAVSGRLAIDLTSDEETMIAELSCADAVAQAQQSIATRLRYRIDCPR